MKNQRRRQYYCIQKNNCAVPDIIPLNKKDNNARPPMRTPVSDDKSSVNSYLGHPHTESEGDFVSDNYDDGLLYNSSYASNIAPLSHLSLTNNSQERDISQEGTQAEPRHK